MTRYLGAKPSCLTSQHATYNDEAFLELMKRLEKFKLTKSELLMICNWRPKGMYALAAMPSHPLSLRLQQLRPAPGWLAGGHEGRLKAQLT